MPAAGQHKKDAGDISDKERALQQTQKRLKEERAKAADARKREAGILSELETIDRRLNDKRKQVAVLDGRIRHTQAEMGDLQRDVARLEGQRAGQEDAMALRLRAMYRLQVQGGALPVLLSGDDPVAQAVRLRHLTTLATVDARMIREYRVTSEGLADRKTRLEIRRRGDVGAPGPRRRASGPRPTARRPSGGCFSRGSGTSGSTTTGWSGSWARPRGAWRPSSGISRRSGGSRRSRRPSSKPPKARAR